MTSPKETCPLRHGGEGLGTYEKVCESQSPDGSLGGSCSLTVHIDLRKYRLGIQRRGNMFIESLRQTIRGWLGYDHPVYKFAAQVAEDTVTVVSEGLATLRLLKELDRQPPGSPTVSVPFRRLLHPFPIRPGTQDVNVLVNNVVRQEYGHVRPLREPAWMIDAGGFIGDTAAYFLSRFPRLQCVLLEPNAKNYAASVMNLAPYGQRVLAVNQGLWSSDTTLRFSGDGTGGAVSVDDGTQIACTCVPTLMERYGIDRIDFLKIDIEGAEGEVLGPTSTTWLGHVDAIMIEIHSDALLRRIRPHLESCGFRMWRYRSIWYCERR